MARTLAWLLTEPDDEMAEFLRERDIYHIFSDYFKTDNGGSPSLEGFLTQENRNDLLQEMKQGYGELFQNPQSGDLWWVESVHKAWTNDPECRLSMARGKGYVMGDPALHMLELYRSFGIEIPGSYSGLPDHIVLELDFLAFLIERDSEESVKVFLRDHLDWVSEMVRRGREYQPSPFYSSVFEALEVFIASEKKEADREASHYA